MHVLMTTDTVGGVWRYALSLAKGLRSFNVVTTFANLGPEASAKQQAEAAAIPGLQLVETGLPLDWLVEDEAAISSSAQELAKMAQDYAADIIQLNSPIFAAFEYFKLPTVGVCHSCLATWWDSTCGGELPPDFLWRTALLARGYNACDKLVAPSRAFAAMTARRYGILPVVVANGADQPDGSRDVAKERFVLTAGRLWDKGKNVTTLDEAAGLLDAPVYAAGALSHPPANEVRCQNAIALGRLDAADLQIWMQRAAIYASMAVYEPFGLAVLEAAQTGCALVLADTDGFRELWDDAALFVSPYDADALSKALQMLLDKPELTARIGESARISAKAFSVDRMAAGMLAIYRSTAARRGLAA